MAAISGVYAAALTPRREGPEIDLAAAFELIDLLSTARVDGITLMGSTGEFPHFSLEERSRLVSLAVKRSRVPILAGVGHSTFDGALALAREAAESGVAGVLLMPPYFFPYRQEEIREFYLRFAERFKDAAPVFLYNIPQFTSEIACETALELLTSGQFAGIKDSSANWADMERLLGARTGHDFAVMAGHDKLFLRARTAGANGTISGIASAIPELLVSIETAIKSGDAARAAQLNARLEEFLPWWDVFPAPVAIREAAAQRGWKIGPAALPLGPSATQKLAEFGEWFRGWFAVVKKECSDA